MIYRQGLIAMVGYLHYHKFFSSRTLSCLLLKRACKHIFTNNARDDRSDFSTVWSESFLACQCKTNSQSLTRLNHTILRRQNCRRFEDAQRAYIPSAMVRVPSIGWHNGALVTHNCVLHTQAFNVTLSTGYIVRIYTPKNANIPNRMKTVPIGKNGPTRGKKGTNQANSNTSMRKKAHTLQKGQFNKAFQTIRKKDHTW